MRIKRLELKAVGPFTDKILDFSSEPSGLHIVYGPNEAGKSSSLRALQALLFGFPQRTDDNFLHPYDQLLVGGCLQAGDGRELLFYRRKRSRNSLFDEQDRLLDPAALDPFLHGLDQDLFTTLYGIDHETLIRGGQDILDQQGDVGQALFSAGTGLASLKAVVDELEGEAEEIFKPRGKNQQIALALANYKEIQSQIKEATLSSRVWQEHRQILEEAAETLQRVNCRRLEIIRQRQQLERLQQAIPLLGERGVLGHKIAAMGEVAELPADFGERRRESEQGCREACARLETNRARLRELVEKRDQLVPDQALLEEAGMVEMLYQELGQYRKAASDRPQLEGRRIGCRSEAAALLRQIRPDLSLDDLESLRPSLARRKSLQDLGGRREILDQTLVQARRRLRSVEQSLHAVLEELRELPCEGDDGGLSRVFQQARKAGDLDGEWQRRSRELTTTRRSCEAALQRLGLWSGPLEATLTLPVPRTETLQRWEQQLADDFENVRRLRQDKDSLAVERLRYQEQLAALTCASEVPSEEEVQRHRRHREDGWQLLRRQWLKGENVAEASRLYDADQPLPDAYEQAVARADRSADRLYREADRVQKHADLTVRIAVLDDRLAELETGQRLAEGRLQKMEDAWCRLWANCQLQPQSPREMLAWLGSFDKLRTMVNDAQEQAAALRELQEQRRHWRALLLKELDDQGNALPVEGEQLEPVLQQAERQLAYLQKLQSRRQSLQERRRELEKQRQAAALEEAEAEQSRDLWQRRWQEAIYSLGLDPQTEPADVAIFGETLQACFEQLKAADEFRVRIQGIDRDSAAFTKSLRDCLARLAPDLQDQPPERAVSQLHGRLGRARAEQARRLQLDEEMQALEQSVTAARAQVAQLEEQRAALHRLAGCDSAEQLDEAERRSLLHRQLQEKLTELEAALGRMAGGQSLDALQDEAQSCDADELPGRLAALGDELENGLEPEVRRLSEIIGREKNELSRMDGNSRAADLAEAGQQQLAAIRHLTERYIRLKLAGTFLREEIERYRAENQDPVLGLASRYFEELTLGSFAGLQADLDDQDRPVLIGLRSSGHRVRVAGMSSGTRDQLYLALRLATLEWRARSNEPMPFIVDDVLINFDDQRSRAGLAALSELAARCQIILFTHHQQILQSARELPHAKRVFIHSL